jgi:DNA-binding response OmpR family regulator
MPAKTVLVASRHPHLEDVGKRVLEEAGYHVMSIRDPEPLKETCNKHKIDLVLIGYSVTAAEKRRIAAEAIRHCKCPILELWDREPPQLRSEHGVFDHFSLTPEDFLGTVNAILRDAPSKQ